MPREWPSENPTLMPYSPTALTIRIVTASKFCGNTPSMRARVQWAHRQANRSRAAAIAAVLPPAKVSTSDEPSPDKPIRSGGAAAGGSPDAIGIKLSLRANLADHAVPPEQLVAGHL